MDPFILTKFIKPKDSQTDPTVGLVVFEWNDKDLIGLPPSNDSSPTSPVSQHIRWLHRIAISCKRLTTM